MHSYISKCSNSRNILGGQRLVTSLHMHAAEHPILKVCHAHLFGVRGLLVSGAGLIIEETGVQTLQRRETERAVDGVEEMHVSCEGNMKYFTLI